MAEPVTLDQAKAQLRIIADTSEDALIASYITAARSFIEDYTGLILVQRTVVEIFDGFGRQGRSVDLRSWPVTSISSIGYLDNSGAAQTLSSALFVTNLAARPVRISMMNGQWWPLTEWASDTVTVTVQAGFATPADVPAALTQAMLLLIGHWYSNRSAVEAGLRAAAIELPFAVDILCNRWRRRVL